MTVVRVLAVDDDAIPMDRFDREAAWLWVTVTAWSPRRAFLTGADPFVAAAGNTPAALVGMRFFAQLDVNNPPGNEETAGERLEWPGLVVCPPLDLDGWLSGERPLDPAVQGGGGWA